MTLRSVLAAYGLENVRPYAVGAGRNNEHWYVGAGLGAFDVAGNGVDGGDIAALDLRYPSRPDAHHRSELGLGEAVALALFSEAVAALPGHQRLAPFLGFRGAKALAAAGLPAQLLSWMSPAGLAGHAQV